MLLACGRRACAPRQRARRERLCAPVLSSRRRRHACPQAVPAAGEEGTQAALLLPWFAAYTRSQLAVQCFVEALVECYQTGVEVDDLQLALQLRSMQVAPQLLTPLEQDTLRAWMLLVVLTLRELRVPRGGDPQQRPTQGQPPGDAGGGQGDPEALPVSAAFQQQVQGLIGYVRQALRTYFKQGYTLQRVQGLQGAVNQGEVSQFQLLMQQYTLLVFVTVEVAAALKLRTSPPLTNPCSLAPTGYTAAYWVPPPGASSATPAASPARAQAVRLMVAFLGAALGSSFSLASFVEAARQAYAAGLPAADLFGALTAVEFAQTGGLVPVPSPQAVPEVNRTLFGRWLTVAYMVLQQLGEPFPASDTPQWTWAGEGDEAEAHGLQSFVRKELERRRRQASAPSGSSLQSERAEPLDEGAAASAPAPAAAERWLRQGKPPPVMVKVADPGLEATSAAVQVWRQQMELVGAVAQAVEAAHTRPECVAAAVGGPTTGAP